VDLVKAEGKHEENLKMDRCLEVMKSTMFEDDLYLKKFLGQNKKWYN
jgi:hypothetical protein